MGEGKEKKMKKAESEGSRKRKETMKAKEAVRQREGQEH